MVVAIIFGAWGGMAWGLGILAKGLLDWDESVFALKVFKADNIFVDFIPTGNARVFDGNKNGETELAVNHSGAEPPSGNPCLLVGSDGACVGGARRTSRLYDAISGFAMFFFCFCASVSFCAAFPTGKPFKGRWLAVSAACLIGCGLFAVAAITGKIWLFGL